MHRQAAEALFRGEQVADGSDHHDIPGCGREAWVNRGQGVSLQPGDREVLGLPEDAPVVLTCELPCGAATPGHRAAASVWRLLAQGMSNAEIARTLGVGDATAKTHVARILTKLGVRDRVQAVVLAYETGIITPGIPAT